MGVKGHNIDNLESSVFLTKESNETFVASIKK